MIAVYPGSFDPITFGHLEIVTRAARLFDRVIIAVFDRPQKNLLFNTAERVAFVEEATRNLPQVKVDTYSELTVDYVRQVGATAIVRGLRDTRDFEQEFQMAQINRTLAPELDVVFLLASHQYTFVSSSTVRELASLGSDVSWLVPPHVVAAVKHAYQKS